MEHLYKKIFTFLWLKYKSLQLICLLIKVSNIHNNWRVIRSNIFKCIPEYALETIVIIDDSDVETNDDDAMPELVDESRQDANLAFNDHDYGPLPKIVSVISATDQLNLTDAKEHAMEE